MQQGLNVIGKFAGEKKKVFEGKNGEPDSTSYKYAIAIPQADGYEGQNEYFEVSIPKSEHHGDIHKSFQALKAGQPVQVFFKKNSGDVNGRKYVNYNPICNPLLPKE